MGTSRGAKAPHLSWSETWGGTLTLAVPGCWAMENQFSAWTLWSTLPRPPHFWDQRPIWGAHFYDQSLWCWEGLAPPHSPRVVYLFSIIVMANYHKFSSLKQHKSISSQFCRSEVRLAPLVPLLWVSEG